MNRRELARYLWKAEDGIEKSDEEYEPDWRWYGIVRLSSWTSYRGARRLLIRWSEQMNKEQPYLYWFAVVECPRRHFQTLIYILIGSVDSKEHCVRWWVDHGVESVSLSNYKPGAFRRFVIEESDDHSTFEAAMDFHYGLFTTDEG